LGSTRKESMMKALRRDPARDSESLTASTAKRGSPEGILPPPMTQ